MTIKPSERWTSVVIGAWLIISPWVLGFAGNFLVKWSSILCGIIIGGMNVWFLSERNESEKK
jgi:hypothetical protein